MNKYLKNLKAWKSTIIGLLLILIVTIGIYSGKLTNEALVGLVPAITLILTNVFKEGKKPDCKATPEE